MSNKFLLLLASSTAFIALVTLFHFPNFAPKTSDNTGELAYAVANNQLSGNVEQDQTEGFIDGQQVKVPQMDPFETIHNVLGANNSEKCIEVDLSEQKLRAWEGNNLYL